jgi:Putative metallopeptidase
MRHPLVIRREAMLGRLSRRVCWVLCGALALVSAPRAQRLPASPADDFVIANVQFVLMHELAHLVIGEKKIPVIGPEETAADYLATMMLIRPPWTRPPGDDTLLKIAVQTADGFAIAWQRAASLGAPIAYWGAHALTVQRFSTVACLVYGSNPTRFTHLPELVGMPVARAASCPAEFEKAQFAVDWLFATYARHDGDAPGAPVSIRIERAPTRTSQRLFETWQASGFIDATFQRLGQFFELEPFTFVARSCREPQARWIAESRELVFCYELLDAYALMSRDQHRAETERLLDTPPVPPARETLNSERIEQAFGSYGVEVLAAEPTVRVSNLYSGSGAERVCRTFAVVRFPSVVDPRLAGAHARILGGESIGAAFVADGWTVRKTHRYFGELPATARVAKLMGGIAPGTPLAVDIYVLDVSRGEDSIEYASIAELHHPDYLALRDLRALYGAPLASTAPGKRLVDEMLALVRRRMR